MAAGTAFRLDTAELAMESGWHVESTDYTDEFTRKDVAIRVHYSESDEIDSVVKHGPNGDHEDMEDRTSGKFGLLRFWLTGRAPAAGTALPPARLGTGTFAQKPGDWTREEFIDAVEDPSDRAFLLRLLELADANDELPTAGPAPRLYFGKRPGGAVFVYHFGRRHPPYKFSVKNGNLMIAGCWTRFPKVEGDPGFADLASMLNLDEKSSAKAVPVAGLDPDDVWEVGETVSRAING